MVQALFVSFCLLVSFYDLVAESMAVENVELDCESMEYRVLDGSTRSVELNSGRSYCDTLSGRHPSPDWHGGIH